MFSASYDGGGHGAAVAVLLLRSTRLSPLQVPVGASSRKDGLLH